jgi:pimeloyl-ACP methyl ester carboxylesterase
MEAPEVRYAKRPDGVSIAYQVGGQGPIDLVFVPGFISHLDMHWTEPGFARFAERLGTFARYVMYDKPGTGLSDPIPYVPDLEERARDVTVVMDAVGMPRASLMGYSEGAPAALLLAATAPERVTSVVLFGAVVVGEPDDEQLADFGMTRDEYSAAFGQVESVVAEWGSGRLVEVLTPDHANPARRRFFGIFERAAASPSMAQALVEAVRRIDVSPILASVNVPTLVLHRDGDFVPIANARVIAQRVPGARLVELPGSDHAFWLTGADDVLCEMEEFLTGVRAPARVDRVLATVMFTDIVESTRRAAELGDAAWREVLEGHEAAARDVVAAHGGRVVKSLGDGHLSVFDGPARAIRCALELRDRAAADGVRLRCGVHTGECESMGDDVGGLAVHIGARVGALAGAGEVLVSSTVKDLVVGSGMEFADRGEHELKGVPGRWRIYAAGERERAHVRNERELRAGDRLALRVARRAPGAGEAAARFAMRLGRRG